MSSRRGRPRPDTPETPPSGTDGTRPVRPPLPVLLTVATLLLVVWRRRKPAAGSPESTRVGQGPGPDKAPPEKDRIRAPNPEVPDPHVGTVPVPTEPPENPA